MEIMQARGDQREWIETFLREGARIGFIGATDHARYWHFAFCMTGVWATEPTREAIFDAIWNRRTIATSAKILLHTEVSGIRWAVRVRFRATRGCGSSPSPTSRSASFGSTGMVSWPTGSR